MIRPTVGCVYGATGRHDGTLSLDEFIEMQSAFSIRADPALKTEVAFRIFDCDGDRYIGKADFTAAVQLLLGSVSGLSVDHINRCTERLISEMDLDGNGSVSYAEFEKATTKIEDFITVYRW